MRDLYQQRLAASPQLAKPAKLSALSEPIKSDDLGMIGLIDETSVAKKGNVTPGVQRQYCGALGKQENGIVTVHLGVCRGGFKTLLDSDLFLPESWSHDRERCRAADIPDSVVSRSKWKIALELLDPSRTNGLQFDTLIFDEYYGGKPDFLKGLDEREQPFLAEVPKSFRVLMKQPRGPRPKKGWTGKRRQPREVQSSVAPATVAKRATRASRSGVGRAGRTRPFVRDGERTDWLIVAHNPATGETKYFESNAHSDTPLDRLLRIASPRWNIEHLFRVGKSELGFSHFEGRSYVSLIRHTTMCAI